MTSFARKGSTSIASHGKGVLRKSVSSPAAASVVNDVHELVTRLESRQHGTVDPLQPQSSSSPRQYVVHEDLVVDILSPPNSDHSATGLDAGSSSAHSQHGTPVSGASASRTPIPDGPVYSALRQELARVKLEDVPGGRRTPSSPTSDGSPRANPGSPLSLAAGVSAAAAQEKKMQTMEYSLEEAKTSNRLLMRALSAVQQRLKQTESERDQLRRERDYFRNLALRFPFTLSAGGYDNVYGAAARRFQSGEN